jgi:tetratricopeptide (TPR) repeat protein
MKAQTQPTTPGMSHIRVACILILSACALRVSSAAMPISDSSGSYIDSDMSQILEAQALTEQGQNAAAVALLEPLVQNKADGLDYTHRGIAWNALGTAYQSMGGYDLARGCYESAIHLPKNLPFTGDAYIAGDKATATRLESAAKESLQRSQQQAAGCSVSADAFQ